MKVESEIQWSERREIHIPTLNMYIPKGTEWRFFFSYCFKRKPSFNEAFRGRKYVLQSCFPFRKISKVKSTNPYFKRRKTLPYKR
jgi:hypothetical protein